MKTLILFDLDGTLVNTAEGITRSVQYALKHFGMTETDQKKMERFIGPPLLESFQREYGFSEEKSNQAIKIYRERYAKKGVYECELYPEVKATLQILKEKGIRLGVASSRPERFCKKILEYLQIAQYFEVIGGARDALGINTKFQVLEDVLKRFDIQQREQAVLIGDTKYDAIGAKEAGIDCIGITYGFEQDVEEMHKAGVLAVFDTLRDVVNYLRYGI